MNVAIIPARGGSKRIPGKNTRAFAGKPMLAHSISTAKNSGLFDRIVVSTDDDEIAKVARAWGAEAPFKRPAELSTDHAITVDVIRHAIDWLGANGAAPAYVCCLYATAPFVQAEDLRKAFELLRGGPWSYVFPATTFDYPVQRAIRVGTKNRVEMLFPEHLTTRSQDLAETLHDAGQFYWGTAAAWKKGTPILGPESTVLRVPRWRVQDIDTEEDWAHAELLMKALNG